MLPVFISFLLSLGIGCWSCFKALLMLSNVHIWNSFKFSKWYFSILNVFRHIFTFLHFSTWTYIYSYHLSQTKRKLVISHHLLIFCELFDNPRFKLQTTVGRKSKKSSCWLFLSGPPATCLCIPKLESWKRETNLKNLKSLTFFDVTFSCIFVFVLNLIQASNLSQFGERIKLNNIK